MSRALVLLIWAALAPGLVWSVDLREQLGVGVVWGRAHELVLRQQTYDDPMSLLEWDIPPTARLELGLTALWSPSTATRVRVALGYPLSWGTMVDQDWRTDALDYARSSHTALATAHVSADLAQSWLWSPWSTSLGVAYRLTSWEGWNGTGVYRSTTGTVTNYTFSGLGIAYRQQWFVPYLEVAWTGGAAPDWQITPSVQVGPFSYGQALDNHFLKDQTYVDTLWGGLWVNLATEVMVPEAWGGWGLRTGAEVHWGAQGTTVISAPKQSTSGVSYEATTAANPAGAWFWEASVAVIVRN